ncbi:MAG: hypothetical protein H7A46_23540 [Verrucomicrobiales bacterium]|nr:hypothetical protein [Verrucomicrobiales bacterium]
MHLLWGARHAVSGKVAMVFSGAQELYAFFLDPTTPLRTRSATVYLDNLGIKGLGDMAATLGLGEREEVVREVLRVCGGHAGLSWLLLTRLASPLLAKNFDSRVTVADFCTGKQELMRRWYDGLTTEAKALAAHLAAGSSATRPSASSVLRAAGLDPALNIRTLNELCFTGVAVREGATCKKVGALFWEFFTTVDGSAAPSPGDHQAVGSRFVFRRTGRLWLFRYDGEDYGCSHTHRDGFLYIAFLLRRGAQPTHCVELRLNCKQPADESARLQLENLLHDIEKGYGPKQKFATQASRTQWKEAIEQIDGLIAEATEAGDRARAEELEASKEKLQQEQRKEIRLGGRLPPESIQEVLEDRTRKAVGKAMKQAVDYLRIHCPRLGEHLGDPTHGIDCFAWWPQYRGQYEWDTEEVATRQVANR